MLHNSLSRTSSVASISDDDSTPATAAVPVVRRTRKRFTSGQLHLLESAFHRNSHPSRDERDALAKLGSMEIKSVTIWFQNKRQMERKVALNNIPSARSSSHSSVSPVASRSISSRPSLDSVASRSELRMGSNINNPRTPTRRHDPHASLWDNMSPSSIVPINPPLAGHSTSKRTLEWACAAALKQSDKHAQKSRRRPKKERGKQESTDEDTDEVITPSCSLTAEDINWTTKPDGRLISYPEGIEDEDMKAALTLCGLGRYSRS